MYVLVTLMQVVVPAWTGFARVTATRRALASECRLGPMFIERAMMARELFSVIIMFFLAIPSRVHHFVLVALQITMFTILDSIAACAPWRAGPILDDVI